MCAPQGGWSALPQLAGMHPPGWLSRNSPSGWCETPGRVFVPHPEFDVNHPLMFPLEPSYCGRPKKPSRLRLFTTWPLQSRFPAASFPPPPLLCNLPNADFTRRPFLPTAPSQHILPTTATPTLRTSFQNKLHALFLIIVSVGPQRVC